MEQEILNFLIKKVEKYLNVKIINTDIPPQGMDGDVFSLTDENGNEYIVKYSKSSMNDALAYNLLADNKTNIPIPKVFCIFGFNENTVLVLEKIKYPLLETMPADQMNKYIPAMVLSLKKIHQIKSNNAGLLTNNKKINHWKDIILSKFNNKNPELNWKKIAQRDSLDEELIRQSVKSIINKIESCDFINNDYSLLHTDFNQRNLFVNPNTSDIVSIIDWSDSVFGDPIYDFARVRMYIWHFNLEDKILNEYYKLLSFDPYQKKLEELYLLSLIIEYLAYYSEELTEFNLGRIKLHQDFLRLYNWGN